MSVQYISDIHLELLNENEINKIKLYFEIKANICVLAGDIGNPFLPSYYDFLLFLSNKFKKIFIIAGNHEYYNNYIIETQLKINEVVSNFINISFLNNSYEDYENIRWIGTTLWTQIEHPEYTINDTVMIKNLTVEKYNELHNEATIFLEKTLDECFENIIECIVITHHLPSDKLTHPKFKTSFYKNYNQFFSCNLDELIIKYNLIINTWFYGHTHMPSIENIYNVSFLCNPIGYKGENNIKQINKFYKIR
jgi:predicted phosphodiesterase